MAFSFVISCLGRRVFASEMKGRIHSSQRPYREYLSCSSHGYGLPTTTTTKMCGFIFLQLAKITCWMGFSNLVFTRQSHLQFLSLLGQNCQVFILKFNIYKCHSLLVTHRKTESKTSYWWDPVTPTSVPLGSPLDLKAGKERSVIPAPNQTTCC